MLTTVFVVILDILNREMDLHKSFAFLRKSKVK